MVSETGTYPVEIGSKVDHGHWVWLEGEGGELFPVGVKGSQCTDQVWIGVKIPFRLCKKKKFNKIFKH